MNTTELLIANGQLVADTLRHLADNEIDPDYFAITSTSENGTEIEHELVITDYALQAASTVEALVEALESAQAIRAAAEKLVRCKGRYHSEQNYRALAALFGVTTPDLPPLDGEARTVTPPDAAHVASVLEFIGSFEPKDIDGDTVELRFDIDGLDTGADASITEYAARGASIIRNFLDGIKCEVKGE